MIESPYPSDQTRWFRGNLHTHTTLSDGAQPMQATIDHYHQLGYDFLMISDHDVLASESDYADTDSRGMTLIPGNEVSRGGMHILHVNAATLVEPDTDRQAVINAINADRGFAVLAHPTWWIEPRGEHAPLEYLRTLDHYTGVEVYNGVIEVLHGEPESNYRWDNLIHDGFNAGRRTWGFANDDCHNVTIDRGGFKEAGLGWNMVCCLEPTVQHLVDAMQSGAFYPTTGVTIESMTVDGDTIHIQTKDAQQIKVFREIGRVCGKADADQISFTFPEDAEYIRFECLGAGGAKAWTQPFYRKDGA